MEGGENEFAGDSKRNGHKGDSCIKGMTAIRASDRVGVAAVLRYMFVRYMNEAGYARIAAFKACSAV